MENQGIFRPSKPIAVFMYILSFFISTGFLFLLAAVFARAYDCDKAVIFEGLTAMDYSKYTPNEIKVLALTNGWGNLLTYIFAFLGIAIFMRDEIKNDTINFMAKPNKNKLLIVAFGFAIIFMCMVIEMFVGQFVSESSNQSFIVDIMNNGGAFPMVIATVLLAPVVEEYIYRKCVFTLKDKYGVIACYVISILLFTFPHMISSPMDDILVWLLQCVPYAASGFFLCLIYHKSNENTYASIIAHMLNNLIAVILVFVSM